MTILMTYFLNKIRYFNKIRYLSSNDIKDVAIFIFILVNKMDVAIYVYAFDIKL